MKAYWAVPICALAALVASGGATTGQPPIQPQGQLTSAGPTPQAPLRLLGPDVHTLIPCSERPLPPDHTLSTTHTLTIKNLNIRRLDERWRLTSGGNSPEPSAPPPGVRRKTRWDLDLKLAPKRFAILRVELRDNNNRLEFMAENYAITAGSEVSKRTICLLRVTQDTAEARVDYDEDTRGDSFSSINIGLKVIDNNAGTYDMPIHLDPNIKNHG